jgi:hypothetical protein
VLEIVLVREQGLQLMHSFFLFFLSSDFWTDFFALPRVSKRASSLHVLLCPFRFATIDQCKNEVPLALHFFLFRLFPFRKF